MSQLQSAQTKVKRTIKDSVFTDLFSRPEYLLQLYCALHPEATNVTEEDFRKVTLENILTDDLYNDLGFMVKNQIIVLVEAQSTWSPNIVIRGALYLLETYRRLIDDSNANQYGSRKIMLPTAELYVIYTGEGHSDLHGKVLSLHEDFFDNAPCALDARVKVLCDGQSGDIISQYVRFCKVINEQFRILGRTKEAVMKAIKICQEENVLERYLNTHQKEVLNIMESIFSQERASAAYVFEVEVKTYIKTLKELGVSLREAVQRVVSKFDFTEDVAENQVKIYWE